MTKLEAIDAHDKNGMTQLLYAIFVGDATRVQALLEQGANPNKPKRDGSTATPLWHAEVDFGLFEVAKVFRAHGAQ